MTYDKLREACERVAEMWLGWHKAEICWFMPEDPCRPVDGGAMELASPRGMALLLDAVEERDGIDIRYHAYDCVDGVRRHRWCLGQETDDIDRFLAEGIDENRYAALVFALDKVGRKPKE